MIDLHSENWVDDAPTTFYPTGRSQSSQPPPPVAIQLTRLRRTPTVTLEIRDLLVAAPWAFSIGLLVAHLHLPFTYVTGAIAGIVFGIGFDRFFRRFL